MFESFIPCFSSNPLRGSHDADVALGEDEFDTPLVSAVRWLPGENTGGIKPPDDRTGIPRLAVLSVVCAVQSGLLTVT